MLFYVINCTSLVVTIMKLSKLYCSLIPRVSCVDREKEPGTHMLCSSGISGNLGNFCKICSVDGNLVRCWGATAKFKFRQYFRLYSVPGKMEMIANQISGIQECISSNCTPLCAIGFFDFSLPTGEDECCIALFTVLPTVFGCVLGTVLVTGVALLGWSSFEFDTIQGNG